MIALGTNSKFRFCFPSCRAKVKSAEFSFPAGNWHNKDLTAVALDI